MTIEQSTFQFLESVSPRDESEQLVDRKEIIIERKEEYPLRVIFAPKSVVNFGAKLVIKTLAGARRKFSIPLLGYGGAAKLDFGGENLMTKERFFHVYGDGVGSGGSFSDFVSDETKWVLPLSGNLFYKAKWVVFNCHKRNETNMCMVMK